MHQHAPSGRPFSKVLRLAIEAPIRGSAIPVGRGSALPFGQFRPSFSAISFGVPESSSRIISPVFLAGHPGRGATARPPSNSRSPGPSHNTEGSYGRSTATPMSAQVRSPESSNTGRTTSFPGLTSQKRPSCASTRPCAGELRPRWTCWSGEPTTASCSTRRAAVRAPWRARPTGTLWPPSGLHMRGAQPPEATKAWTAADSQLRWQAEQERRAEQGE